MHKRIALFITEKRTIRRIFMFVCDILTVIGAVNIGLFLKYDTQTKERFFVQPLVTALVFALITVGVFYVFRLYNSLWEMVGVDEIVSILTANTVSIFISFLVTYFVIKPYSISYTLFIIIWMISLIGTIGSRAFFRVAEKYRNKINLKTNRQDISRVLVIGAGFSGRWFIKTLRDGGAISENMIGVAVIDDDKKKQGMRICGIPVVGGRESIVDAIEKYNADQIIFAIPSASPIVKKEFMNICKQTHCKIRSLPTLKNIINHKASISKLENVQIEDLLGREPVRLNNDEISGYIKDSVVLVTGGGGSIGSELCRVISEYNPKKLLVFDIYENSSYELFYELRKRYGNKLDVEILIGSVRDRKRLDDVFSKYRPEVVFHAAAHKHVPLMETSPAEAVKNNVFGTLFTAECAHKYGCREFVLISTDKAVNPANVMGATKRIAELVIQSMAGRGNTKFVAVRFGNVLGSNGSVIPIFKKQIAEGGPVTVTHKDITRYFMTINEAVQLVLQAGAMAKGGEIFILDMGEPVKIDDLARDMLRLSGLEPDVDIKIEYSGLRAGEKMYEELMLPDEGVDKTPHEKIFVSKPVYTEYSSFLKEIELLEKMLITGKNDSVFAAIKSIVPNYHSA